MISAGRTAEVPSAGGGAGPTSSGWREQAACRGIAEPDLFFPVAEAGPVLAGQEAAAKKVCARCVVRPECLGFALVALPEGVAGGLTADERRTLRRRVGSGDRESAVEDGAWWPADRTRGRGREVTAAGRAAVRAGRPVRQVALEFGVSERTAHRWAAHVRAETTRGEVPATG